MYVWALYGPHIFIGMKCVQHFIIGVHAGSKREKMTFLRRENPDYNKSLVATHYN
jgi:hypothetical protein